MAVRSTASEVRTRVGYRRLSGGTMDDLLYSAADHVATITLHRPDRLNALTL